MIISKLVGGLGNQLFQYAAGRSLALQHKTKLVLDINSFEQNRLRNFDMVAFHTELNYATPSEVTAFLERNIAEKIRDNIFPMHLRKVYKQKYFYFHKRFFSAPADIYLQGYWQSEKYFAPIADTIRKEFVIRPEYVKKVSSFGQQLRNENSVSIHIRRGDYKDSQKTYEILGKDYYTEAISLIDRQFPGVKLYFFSDDMQWVKDNLPINNAVYLSGKISNTHFEDFYLMSQCRHNIIANSTFSWWAAWLNNNPNKKIIAPKKWFNNGPKDTQDLIPDEWLQL